MAMLAGIILAAGLSSRMGAFKPLLDIGGKSMAVWVTELLQSAGAEPVVVVTGHRREELERHLSGRGLQFVFNPDYACTQQMESLQLGLAALPEDCRRVLVTPADIPLVRPETVKRLLAAKGDFIRPRCGGRTGHPVVLSARWIPALLNCNGSGGLRGAIRDAGCAIEDVEVEDIGVLMDNDTPRDFSATLHLSAARRITAGGESK